MRKLNRPTDERMAVMRSLATNGMEKLKLLLKKQ